MLCYCYYRCYNGLNVPEIDGMKCKCVRDDYEWYPALAILWSSNFGILDSNGIPSCTSAGSVLQLCKVSQNSNKLFRRNCAYKKTMDFNICVKEVLFKIFECYVIVITGVIMV
jgi:hypothetical protein